MTVELANKLIDHYEKAISVVRTKKHIHSARRTVETLRVDSGLCYCAKHMFGVSLADCDFIKSLLPKSGLFIAHPAFYADSVSEMVSLLQYRVNILKQFKTENNGSITDSGIGE